MLPAEPSSDEEGSLVPGDRVAAKMLAPLMGNRIIGEIVRTGCRRVEHAVEASDSAALLTHDTEGSWTLLPPLSELLRCQRGFVHPADLLDGGAVFKTRRLNYQLLSSAWEECFSD